MVVDGIGRRPTDSAPRSCAPQAFAQSGEDPREFLGRDASALACRCADVSRRSVRNLLSLRPCADDRARALCGLCR